MVGHRHAFSLGEQLVRRPRAAQLGGVQARGSAETRGSTGELTREPRRARLRAGRVERFRSRRGGTHEHLAAPHRETRSSGLTVRRVLRATRAGAGVVEVPDGAAGGWHGGDPVGDLRGDGASPHGRSVGPRAQGFLGAFRRFARRSTRELVRDDARDLGARRGRQRAAANAAGASHGQAEDRGAGHGMGYHTGASVRRGRRRVRL